MHQVCCQHSDGVQFSAVEHAHCSVERGDRKSHHAYPVTSPEIHSLSIRCPVGNSPSCLRQGASHTSACHRRCAASLQLASLRCRSIAGFERHVHGGRVVHLAALRARLPQCWTSVPRRSMCTVTVLAAASRTSSVDARSVFIVART